MMHSHDTYESFMVIDGAWRLSWEGADGVEHADLGPLDFICVPVGVNRAFECIGAAPGSAEGTMLGLVGGDEPRAIPTPEALAACAAAGPPPLEYA